MTSDQPVGLRPAVVGTLPLTATQRAIWTSQRLAPDAPLANMGDRFRIDGPLDPDRLIDAFSQIVAASPALRTVIATDDDGEPVARILARAPRATELIDLAVDDLDDWSNERISTPIDAATCVYDSVLLRHGDDRWTWWLDIHHVATDAASAALLFAATSSVYEGGSAHELVDTGGGLYAWAAASRDEPGASRADDGPDGDDDREAGASAATEWSPYGRRGARTTEVERIELPLDDEVRDALEHRLGESYRSLSRELSLLALSITITAVLGHRFEGRTSLTVGVPIHHRRTPDARRTVGPLMRLSPVTVEVDPDATWREQFSQVLRNILDLLRRASPDDPDPGERFDVVANVITATFGSFAGMRTERRWMRSGHVEADHVVRHQLFDRTDPDDPDVHHLDWELDINTSLSADGTHRALPRHLARALVAAVTDPDARHGDAVLADDADRADAALLIPDPAPRRLERPVHDEIRRRLRLDPNRIVVEQNELVLTAGELDRRADALARSLAGDGLGGGSAIGLKMSRSTEVLVAIQGVLRAGAHFVILDPDDPTARHERIIAEASVALVLDRDDVLDRCGVGTADEPSTGSAAADPGSVDVDPDDLAYVLFTSGSTGTPKGVPISHRGLADYLGVAVEAYVDAVDHGPDGPVVALHSSLAFDLTITSLFLPFLGDDGVTGRVIVFDDEPVEAMRRIADDPRITFLKATPSHLELLTRLASGTSGLRELVVGGEAFRRPLAERLRALAPDATIHNEYGPTEAVVGCMIHRWDPDLDLGPDVPIGAAMPGTELAVLDAAGRVAPTGVWGELFVRRPGMAERYLDRPELSAERFVSLGADVLAVPPVAYDRPWYRTGDRVRIERPGVLVYGGRADDQLKVGGIRLEPAEVEAALVEHPAISSAFARTWTLAPPATDQVMRCVRCGLGDDVPGIEIDAAGVCTTCRAFEQVEPQTRRWFRTELDLDEQLARARARRTGDIDALHLLSGGKDSTYALYQLVDRGWKVHAFTLDNGFISDGAKANIRRSVADLGITHEFAMPESQTVMNEIFRDSLARYSNVCQGCYKTIYTLGVARARELGIPLVVTGLSRGQFFETRLVPHQFEEGHFDPDEIDATVLEARRVYHHTPDAVTELLPEQRVFDTDDVFDHVEFLDFYRYVDVELAELYRYLDERAPWVRPDDTGRSTNCLINVAGISTHRAERGFHNYAEPYAWDVRLGHKTRHEALDELDDEIDPVEVDGLLDAVGYEPSPPEVLTAWYTLAAGEADHESIDPDELRAFLRDRLPSHAVPAAFVRVDEIPLAASSKVDTAALPAPTRFDRRSGERVEPATDTERRIAEIWAAVLHLEHVGVTDDFFELGGASLAALDVVARCDREFATDLPDASVFRSRTVRELAELVDRSVVAAAGDVPSPATASTSPVRRFRRPDGAPAPLAPGQEAMLLEVRSLGEDPRYNVTLSHRLRGDLDVAALESAIRDVVDHHETLHTCFDMARTTLPSDRAMSWVDLGEMTDDGYDAVAEVERRRPFDLEAGPLVRCHVARVPATDAADSTIRLLVGIHHLAIDASSFDVFWDQVTARLEGRPLPELPVTYSDYLASSGPPTDDDLAFWRGRAAEGVDSQSAIRPPDTGEPDGYVSRPASVDAAALRSSGVTPFVVSLTAAAITAAAFRGQDRVELGVPMSTRTDPEAGDLIGYFLNTVPVQLDVSGAATIRELLERASAEVTDVLPHRTTPLAAIVRDRRRNGLPEPDTSFLLAHEVFRSGAISDDEHPLVAHEVLPSGTAVADATLFIQERADAVSIAIEYSGSAIGRARAERMLDLFDAALSAAGSRPTTPPATLQASAAHPDLTGPPLRAEPTVLHSLVESMRSHPDSIAVVDHRGDERSAAQVAVDVSALAAQIDATIDGAAVVGRRRIGVALGRTTGLVESMLATWLVDGVYVPLDVDAPDARLAAMVEIADLDLVIADLADGEPLPDALGELPVLDLAGVSASPAIRSDPSATYDWLERRADALDPASTAYVIFTSGSTGRPRGVDVTHGNLAASTAARDVFDDGTPPRFLITPSPTFDSSMVGLVWPLTCGGTVVLAGDDDVGDVDRLGDLIRRTGVDHTLMVPSLFGALLRRRADRLRGLRRAVVAGEACTPALVAEHERLLPGVELINEYGPTEATVWATWHRLDGVDLGASDISSLPIGSPIAGLTARIADQAGRPLPPGTTGELWLSGPTLANGYLGDRQATSARFVHVDDRRWYRTGDLVVWGDDDVLVFIGRVDDQLNVGGLRIEPGEIESAIAGAIARPAAAVAVVAAGDPPELVAHVESDGPIDTAAVRRSLAGTLPGGTIPRRVVMHEALPRTGRGKLDRRRLEAWPLDETAGEPGTGVSSGRADDTTAGGSTAALTPLGNAILDEWRQVLDWASVDADTDFFAAGGDSISAVELVTSVEDRIGRPVAIATLLGAPSPRAMAEALAADGAWMPDATVDDASTDPPTPAPSRAPIAGDDGIRIVTMRRADGTEAAPLVLMVPAWDDVFAYQALADAIDATVDGAIEIAALAYTEVEGLPLITRVDDLVDRFVARLDGDALISADRPVVVVGWSVGGVVAVEIGERLAASGVPIVETVLVDTYFPGQHLHLWSNRWWKYKSMLRPDTLGEVGREFTTMFRRRLQRYAKRIGTRLLAWSGTELPPEPPRTSAGGFPVEALTHEPSIEHVPLFMVSASTTNPERTRNRWREIAPDLEYVVVPGRHRGFESVMAGDRVEAVAVAVVGRLAAHLDTTSSSSG